MDIGVLCRSAAQQASGVKGLHYFFVKKIDILVDKVEKLLTICTFYSKIIM